VSKQQGDEILIRGIQGWLDATLPFTAHAIRRLVSISVYTKIVQKYNRDMEQRDFNTGFLALMYPTHPALTDC
jgi:hypothetical protein